MKKINFAFDKIRREYNKFYNSFLMEGRFFMRKTEVGYWGTTNTDGLFEFFNNEKMKTRLKSCRGFLDLGSGDGVVCMIASLFVGKGCKIVGVEYDKELVEKSNKFKKLFNKKGFTVDNINFKQNDYMAEDLSKYDILFINPDQHLKEIEWKIQKEFKAKNGIIIITRNMFQPVNLILKDSFKTKDGFVFDVFWSNEL